MFLLSLWSSLILFLTRKRVREIAPYATAVLLGFGAFFISLTVFFANPFATIANPPPQGAGLDPLLLHPSMMIHPPMLYSGYTLLTIPFAFAIGALVTGRLGNEWIASRGGSRSRRGCSSGSGSCSARAGPTPSSAGAATGPGIRSRTRR